MIKPPKANKIPSAPTARRGKSADVGVFYACRLHDRCSPIETQPLKRRLPSATRTDADVWQAAQREGRLFITQDLDFSDTRKFLSGTHLGIVLIRLQSPSRQDLIARANELFRAEDMRSPSKKGLGPHGSTICSSLMSPKWWSAIRARMLCSNMGTKMTASMLVSWPTCYASMSWNPSTTGTWVYVRCGNWHGVI
jgi:predicted nuclease of predicted toxin-antitoxin system